MAENFPLIQTVGKFDKGETMESESNFIATLLVYWGPILFLLVVWIVVMKKAGVSSTKKYMDNTTGKLEEQLEEMKKMNKNLEQISEIINQKFNLR